MNAWDFDCVVYDSDYYCVECLPDGVNEEPEEVFPVFASEEVTEYPICCVCGEVHEYMTLLCNH